MSKSTVAAVVPTYNESTVIEDHLRYHRNHFDFDTITVVDGGSTDGTYECIRQLDGSVRTERITPGNRARQLAEGVRVTDSDYLLFLHADTYLPEPFSLSELRETDARWGWFDCRLDDPSPVYTTIGKMISLRSAFFSSPTGDQAIWVQRQFLETVGGIPQQPLMEDVELSLRLSRHQPGKRIPEPVTTSARRWKENGTLRTILTMWGLKVGYYLGISPKTLAEIYYGRTNTDEP